MINHTFRKDTKYVKPFLTDVKQSDRSLRTGLPEIKGYLNNYAVIANNAFITLIGSISEYWNYDNTISINNNELKLAIKSLCEELHLQINKAHLLRVDVSNSLPVSVDPNVIFPLFGRKGKQYPKRLPDGINYGNKGRSYWTSFYKKGSDMLRYELKVMRPKSVLQPILKGKKPTLEDLLNPNIYNLLLKRWQQHYYKVEKINELPQHFDIIGTKDVDRARAELIKIMCPAIDRIIDAAIEQRHVNGGYKHYKQYNRCKSHLKGKQAKFVLGNPLILELDNQIEATYKSYLV